MKKLGNKIKKIVSCDSESYSVILKYDDNSIREISLAHLFDSPKGLTLEILKGNLFPRCFVESGALAWPNGFELCPDALLRMAVKKKSAA